MKKWTCIGALALLIGAGYLGFQQYKIYIPGIISEWREPIGEIVPLHGRRALRSLPLANVRPTSS